MKKIISILLVVMLSASLFACGKNSDTQEAVNSEEIVETDNTEGEKTEETGTDTADTTGEAEVNENAKPVSKPTETQNKQPQTTKPAETPTETKPAETPTEKPAEKPVETPTEKPAEKPATLGNKLLAAFKANASSKSGEALANAILSIPEIQFHKSAFAVEEGYLTGFGNAEIKGFKSGVTFGPSIGSIPFVGYVFELENASDVSGFISTLKANADLRWNICTEADEMVTGSVGNKVFFVMCPTSMDN